jgi:hypothetical protein
MRELKGGKIGKRLLASNRIVLLPAFKFLTLGQMKESGDRFSGADDISCQGVAHRYRGYST